MRLLIELSINQKNKRENFLRLFLANSLIREGRPFTFLKKNFGKPLDPYQRVVTVDYGNFTLL